MWLEICSGGIVLLIVAFLVLDHMGAKRQQVFDVPEPEIHNDQLLGFKALYYDEQTKTLLSPDRKSDWSTGRLIAHQRPTLENGSGIYVFKTLQLAKHYYPGRVMRYFLVSMEEPIAEHEYGYRAMIVNLVKEV